MHANLAPGIHITCSSVYGEHTNSDNHFSLNALPKIRKDLFGRDREILRTMKDLSESFLFQKHQRLPIWIKIEYFILGPYIMTDCILTHLGTNHNKSCPCVSFQVMSSS